jgi:hypothetical protein
MKRTHLHVTLFLPSPLSLSETNSHHQKGALRWLLMIQKKQSLGVFDLEIDPAAINPVKNKETWDVCTVE